MAEVDPPPLHRRSAAHELAAGTLDIARCLRLIGAVRCRSEDSFDALSGRFKLSCAARECPVRAAGVAPSHGTSSSRAQSGGTLYHPRPRHRR